MDSDAKIFLRENLKLFECVGPVTINYGRCEERRFEKGDNIEIELSDGDILEFEVVDVIYHDDQSIELTVERKTKT